MGMLTACVNLQLGQHFGRKFVFRKHAANSFGKDRGRILFHAGRGILAAQTGITSRPGVTLLLPFFAGELHFISVDHDNKTAGADVRGVIRAVFAHQSHCNIDSKTTNDFIRRVDQDPLLFHICRFRHERFHNEPLTKSEFLLLVSETRTLPHWDFVSLRFRKVFRRDRLCRTDFRSYLGKDSLLSARNKRNAPTQKEIHILPDFLFLKRGRGPSFEFFQKIFRRASPFRIKNHSSPSVIGTRYVSPS